MGRESIWTPLAENKHWYLGIFTVLTISSEAVVIREEIGRHQGKMETWRAVLGPSADMMATSAGAAYALTELGRNAVVIAKSLENWLEDRRKKRLETARQEGLSKGREEGRQENQKAWAQWNARREAAARGEIFTELPPNEMV